MEDMAKQMGDGALGMALGLGEEERDELMAKCASGDMNFDDFMKVSAVINRMGGAKGAVGMLSKFASVPGAEDADGGEADKKLKEWEVVMNAMQEDERKDPNLLLGAAAAEKKQRIARIAQNAGIETEDVEAFLNEFSGLKKLFGKLGSGKSFDEAGKELAEEKVEEELAKKSRSARRNAKKKKAGMRGAKAKTPEWMNF